MNAIKLRNLLLAGIGLALVAIGAIIYFASDYLSKQTVETTHAKIDAELSATDIEHYKQLQQILEKNKLSIEKANQIVSDSAKYEYQDQIIKDIDNYAAQTGVTVKGYDFGNETTNASTANDPTIPKVNGVKSLPVTVNLQSPMPFDNYLRFVKAVEQNLTKMQVRGINITPDTESSNSISNPSVTLIVFVR